MVSHRADLPEDPSVNHDMQFRLVNRIVKATSNLRFNWGIALIIIILAGAGVGLYFTWQEFLSRLNP